MKTVLRLKDGVLWVGTRLETVTAILRIWELFDSLNIPELTVTSLLDGRHMTGSKHPKGEAVDIRTHGLGTDLPPVLVQKIKTILGPGYDVILENRGTPNEHIHVEWDPKSVIRLGGH
jgi:hypothetical protein